MEQIPTSNNGTESKFTAFINAHPEYKAKEFTAEEIHDAAKLIDSSEAGESEEVIQKALDARLSVREVAGKEPVINDASEVIGMAKPGKEENSMLQQDRITRDAA